MLTQPSSPIFSFKNQGHILVALQIFSLLGLLITGPVIPGNPWLGVIMLLGLVLAIWSFISMKWSNFSIHPIPRKDGKLITKGPYRWIRHPMYTSLFLIFTPILNRNSGWDRLVFFASLCLAIAGKIWIEEKVLENRFPSYSEYRKKTWFLFPGLF